jgi:hypothetical protein
VGGALETPPPRAELAREFIATGTMAVARARNKFRTQYTK